MPSSYEVGRRRLLQTFGLTAAAGTAAMMAADPVLGATLGYDESIGVKPEAYEAPAGLAMDGVGRSLEKNCLKTAEE